MLEAVPEVVLSYGKQVRNRSYDILAKTKT